MKRIQLLVSILILNAQLSYSQDAESLFKKGDSLYKIKDYKNSAIAYSAGIKIQGKQTDESNYWRAASRWALAKVPDSTFYFLELLSKSSNISQGDVNGIVGDKDFNSVQSDNRWTPIMEKIMTRATANYKIDELIYGRKDGVALTMLHVKQRVKSNNKSIILVIAVSCFSSYQQAERTIRPSAMFLDKGFSIFLVILGSQPRYAIPDEIEDLKRAIRYVRYNAKKFEINPEQIGITGGSAGGHLSLAAAMADKKIDSMAQDPINRVSSRVQAAAVLYPPTDCLNWGGPGFNFINNKSLQMANNIYGALDFTKWNQLTSTYDHITDSSTRMKIAREMSPIYYVSPDDPPIFIIHGDADKVVPLQQSETFVSRLKQEGVQNKFIIKKGGVHNPGTMMPEFLDFPDWFDKNLK
jgi:acetyl esterase/lipase